MQKKRGLSIFLITVAFAGLLALLFNKANTLVNFAMYSPRIVSVEQPDISYQEFSINIDGDTIKGWILGNLIGPKRAVILASGYQGSKSLLLPLAKWFVEKGFVSVVFDPRGEGESGGKIYALGALEDEDIEAIMDYMEENYGISQFVLCGFSCGATASIIAASENPEKVIAVIADSPFANLHKAQGGGILKFFWTFFCNYLGYIKTGINVYKETNALAVIDRVSRIMFIHGKEDKTIPYSNSIELYKKARKPKKLWLVEGAGHAEAIYIYTQEYLQKVLNFIQICIEEAKMASLYCLGIFSFVVFIFLVK